MNFRNSPLFEERMEPDMSCWYSKYLRSIQWSEYGPVLTDGTMETSIG